MKYRIKFLIVLASILLITSACNIDRENVDQGNNKEGVDYLIVNSGEISLPLTPFNTLNPLMNNNESYYHFSKLIFEGLFEFDDSMKPKPDLVNTYTIKNGGKTVTLNLREDVYWHDGEKFTADDVLFTINAINYAGDQSIYIKMFESLVGTGITSNKGNILNAIVIDDYTIDINFDRIYSNNLELLTFPIIPSHRFTNNSGVLKLELALKLEEYIPIGTGPYKYISYDKSKSVNLEANDSYREEEPSIEKIVGKILGSEELFLTAYEAGQIDVVPIKDVDWDKYKQNIRITTIEYISSDYEFLGFNFDNELISQEKGQEVRKAIYYGINRQEIIQKIFLGHATQIDVPIHPNSWLISDEANMYGYNVERSKEILFANGFIDIDDDGILEDENGNKLSFRLLTNPSNKLRLRTAEMIREDLKSIGIHLILDFDTSYRDDITMEEEKKEWDEIRTRLSSGNYDIALLGWQTSVIPELSTFFHSSQIGANNFINYSNPTFDILLNQISDSYEEDVKISLHRDAQEYLLKELPYISLFYRNRALLLDSRIHGEIKPGFFNLYNGLEKCFIVTKSDLS